MSTARDFTDRLIDLLRSERAAMAEFLVALSDFDARRLWADLGHASLFAFLRRELRLSAGAAHRGGAHPALSGGRGGAPLRRALSVVGLRARQGPDARERGGGLAAILRPVESGRRLRRGLDPAGRRSPAPRGGRRDPGGRALHRPSSGRGLPARRRGAARASAPETPPKRSTVEPLDADSARLHLTVSRRFLSKLDAVKSALSHAQPGATSEQVLEACLDLMLAQHAKRRGLVAKPRNVPRPTRTDAVPTHVKRPLASARRHVPP